MLQLLIMQVIPLRYLFHPLFPPPPHFFCAGTAIDTISLNQVVNGDAPRFLGNAVGKLLFFQQC
jgi:hypothetical protein